jgi:hypothetical protein
MMYLYLSKACLQLIIISLPSTTPKTCELRDWKDTCSLPLLHHLHCTTTLYSFERKLLKTTFQPQTFGNCSEHVLARPLPWCMQKNNLVTNLRLLQFSGFFVPVFRRVPEQDLCHQHNWAIPADMLNLFFRFRPTEKHWLSVWLELLTAMN